MAFGDRQIAGSIEEVLQALSSIIDRAKDEESRLGYFATLYRKVTERVKDGIAAGFFEDGPRMERLDVVFANRYLAALARWQEEKEPTRSWQLAFTAAESWRPIVLQHLLLGINAHINLDLGIAAATVAPGRELPGLATDFGRINEILFGLIDSVQTEIGRISPWIAVLDRIGGRTADELVRFSLGLARDEAWRFAQDLAQAGNPNWAHLVELRDRETEAIGERVRSPGWLLTLPLLVIRCRETASVARVIDVLSGADQPSFATLEARRQARAALPTAP